MPKYNIRGIILTVKTIRDNKSVQSAAPFLNTLRNILPKGMYVQGGPGWVVIEDEKTGLSWGFGSREGKTPTATYHALQVGENSLQQYLMRGRQKGK